VEINGQKVRPVDVTAKLLFPKWKLKPGEEDFTLMRVIVEGTENGIPKNTPTTSMTAMNKAHSHPIYGTLHRLYLHCSSTAGTER